MNVLLQDDNIDYEDFSSCVRGSHVYQEMDQG